MKRLGILLSGRGSNFMAIAEAIKSHRLLGAQIAIVLSNVANSPGIVAAQKMGLKTAVVESRGRSRDEHDMEVIARLHQHKVDLVILAGYMRILSPRFIGEFPERILNIHPSLLPDFPGMHAHRDVLVAGVKESGCTVHFVNEQVDDGTIILQRSVPVLPGDTEETLAARVLEQEHGAYPEAIARVLSGKYESRDGYYVRRAGADDSTHVSRELRK
ncbi:MAG TPA: phosphoribosylglycinamide formyltransferase [Acidobacteriaceae bacterium]